MARVIVRILHAEPGPASGPLERSLAGARAAVGERHVRGFRAAGADDVTLVHGEPDDTPFGSRLRLLVSEASERGAGLVVLGSGSMPLARDADRREFVAIASGALGSDVVLANNRYSADAIAIPGPHRLPRIPDLPGDNALPRWLEERAGRTVRDLRRFWRLQVDLDSPLDEILAGGTAAPGAGPYSRPGSMDIAVRERLDAIRAIAANRRAELLIAGRTSAATVRWLEEHAACRVRVFIEERGLRAGTRLAIDDSGTFGAAARPDRGTRRPPRSLLGALLQRDGPEALGDRVSELCDGALIDSRVLLAHRLGVDEAAWPGLEDRFASDLLLADRIVDPWLRALTASATQAPVPIVLGGHTLVGPGARLALRSKRALREGTGTAVPAVLAGRAGLAP